MTSVAAFALGILLARGGGYPSRLVALHRLFTLAAVVGSAACLATWVLARRGAYRAALGLTVLLLTVGAHYGGSMTRGEGYLVRYAPGFAQELLGEAPREAAPADAAAVISAEPLVFHDVLLPCSSSAASSATAPSKPRAASASTRSPRSPRAASTAR